MASGAVESNQINKVEPSLNWLFLVLYFYDRGAGENKENFVATCKQQAVSVSFFLLYPPVPPPRNSIKMRVVIICLV